MIIGLLFRNIKAYEGLHFSRISNPSLDRLSIYIGNNGAGKSSILEALDYFYNRKKWNTNKSGKPEDAFIAPIVLIPKSPTPSRHFEFISNYFWNISEEEILNNRKIPAISSFLNFRDELKKSKLHENHHLFVCGIKQDAPETPYFSTFDHDLKEKCSNAEIGHTLIKHTLETVRTRYSLIYLPVETSVKDLLNLEHFEMQSMMNKELTAEIDKILRTKGIEYTDGSGKKKDLGIVELITLELDNFLDSINNTIKKINNDYAYKKDGRARNIKASDIRDNIIQAYFSTRTLTKGKKSITELSSGEKRIALIDIAHAFLSQKKPLTKEIILAIDEPESSMHTSMSYKQFSRITEIANKYNKQVLITTHWYGLLPTCQNGAIHHINSGEKIEIRSFNLENIFEERRHFPQDIALKSFFDLASSIISLMRSESCNWLICEGSDDAKYFKFFLGNSIQNLNILPAGGRGNVVKIYKHLLGPLSEKTESKLINGKILCIVDTDIEQLKLGLPSECEHLAIKRLQRTKDTVQLADPESGGTYHVTAIEDCLISEHYNRALALLLKEDMPDLHELLTENYTNIKNTFPDVSQGLNSIKPNTTIGYERKQEIIDAATKNENKYKICSNYIQQPPHTPLWTKAIINFFNNA